MISTHAPRTGSDHPAADKCAHSNHFNPRSPHGERPAGQLGIATENIISTHAPRTGSDAVGSVAGALGKDFNPRSPHGERRRPQRRRNQPKIISTHAPRTGSDVDGAVDVVHLAISTHAPRTGSDSSPINLSSRSLAISTHAPRTGSDFLGIAKPHSTFDFNPRSPHGERRGGVAVAHISQRFQPTLPARGATVSTVNLHE